MVLDLPPHIVFHDLLDVLKTERHDAELVVRVIPPPSLIASTLPLYPVYL